MEDQQMITPGIMQYAFLKTITTKRDCTTAMLFADHSTVQEQYFCVITALLKKQLKDIDARW